jgi:hypothetical protein
MASSQPPAGAATGVELGAGRGSTTGAGGSTTGAGGSAGGNSSTGVDGSTGSTAATAAASGIATSLRSGATTPSSIENSRLAAVLAATRTSCPISMLKVRS